MSRELDALVATKLFGAFQAEWNGEQGHWFVPHNDGNLDHKMHLSCVDSRLMGHNVRHNGMPMFSENMDAAWVVVRHLRAKGWWWDIYSCYGSDGAWRVSTDHKGDPEATRVILENKDERVAICLAALRAVGVGEEEITKAQQGGGNGRPERHPESLRGRPTGRARTHSG